MERQFRFALEADKEKRIGRQTYISNGEEKENDAEHAWHAALMAILLAEYANEPIDVLRTVTREREEKAADRIFGMLPGDQRDELRALWEEFEAAQTPEAKFARTMDNIQPAMLNCATGGRAWREKGVKLSQIINRNKITPEGSKELWEYSLNNFIMPNVEKGNIIDK